jgi:hypothetical protein
MIKELKRTWKEVVVAPFQIVSLNLRERASSQTRASPKTIQSLIRHREVRPAGPMYWNYVAVHMLPETVAQTRERNFSMDAELSRFDTDIDTLAVGVV